MSKLRASKEFQKYGIFLNEATKSQESMLAMTQDDKRKVNKTQLEVSQSKLSPYQEWCRLKQMDSQESLMDQHSQDDVSPRLS